MRKWMIWFVLVAVLALAACTQTPDPGATTQPVQEALPPIDVTVTGDQGALSGKVVSTAGGRETPLANTTVWLAYVQWGEDGETGAFYIDGAASPSAVTRADGTFALQGLEPRDYVIVVGDLYGDNAVLSNSDNSARIYVVNPGEVLDVGTLEVDLVAGAATTPVVPQPETGYPGQATPVQRPDPYP